MVTESVNEILDSAATYACHTGLSYIDVSLVALATLQTNEVKAYLKQKHLPDQAICEEICVLFDKLDKQADASSNARFGMSPSSIFVYKMGEGLAKSLNKDFSPLHLLVGLADGKPHDGHYQITEILERHGLFASDLYEHISYTSFLIDTGTCTHHKKSTIEDKFREELARVTIDNPLADCPMLQQFCENLVTKARAGTTDPVIGRDKEINRTIRILSRRKKNNPILLGEPGVGKTSVAEELARLIAEGEVPTHLQNKIVLSLDLGALVGGTKWRGDLEERLKNLLAEVKAQGNVILFIDEIHLLTGRMLEGCSDLLKPALANGELTAIGATTHAEYLMHFEKDAAMARRFQPVIVNEPDRNTAVGIIRGVLSHYAEHHGVQFDFEVAEYAVDMAIRHNPRQALPDKAIDLIDEAGAAAVAGGHSKVTRQLIDAVIQDMVGATVFEAEEAICTLRQKVIGQAPALEATERFLRAVDLRIVSGEIKGTLSISGGEDADKSQFVKSLVEATGSRLLELDGRHYQHESATWRLLGSMPGYKDHEKGGQLSEALRRCPRTLIAITHFELAHSDVQDLIITLISQGVITDSAKKSVSASEAYVVFLGDVEQTQKFGFLGGAIGIEEPLFGSDLKELIDVHLRLEQPTKSDLAEMLNVMTQKLQQKMMKAGRSFQVSEELKASILDTCEKSNAKIGVLKQQFQLRIKNQLLSRTSTSSVSMIIGMETT